MLEINGKEIEEKEFAFDGCHKFYLISKEEEKAEAEGYEYDIYPIEKLPKMFWNSCPLRFISKWDLSLNDSQIVPQCVSKVIFRLDGKKIIENFSQDKYEEINE